MEKNKRVKELLVKNDLPSFEDMRGGMNPSLVTVSSIKAIDYASQKIFEA